MGKCNGREFAEVTRQTPDISECLEFDLYACVWWLDKNHPSTTDNNIILGRCIKISHKIGSNMCYWVLTVLVKVVARNTLQHVIFNALIYPDMKRRIDKFDEELEKLLDDTNFVDDIMSDLYIDDVNKYDEAACWDGSNTLSDEAYGGIMT